jgi:serine phosphatase RsbU (regulator of sigma subunit)
VVGDATGKGVPAALMMTGVCAFLGGVATASGSSSPGEVLARVNEALLARIAPNMFVTCFYAILELRAATSSTPTQDTASPAAAAKMRPLILVRGGCP